MNTSSALLALLLALPASASAAAAEPLCGLPGGAALRSYADSVNAAPHAPQAAALTQVYGFPDLRALLAARPGRACVTAVPVSKNIYQYYKYLVVVSLGEDGRDAVLPFVFQAASIQAYENVGRKPWLGLGRRRFDREMKALAAGAAFTEAPQPKVLTDLLDAMYPGAAFDPHSRSALLLPDMDPAYASYLVVQLRFIDTGNPFTSQYAPQAGLVQVDLAAQRARYAPLGGFFGAASALEDAQQEARPEGDAEARRLRLLELSGSLPRQLPQPADPW